MKVLKLLMLDKEAMLFDTKEFLIKAFVAVLLGSFVGQLVPYVAKDMISLLFGMMLTIEPVNLTGIRSGLKQVEATILGALITGIVLAFFGYSPWTAALTITLTLYVSLLIDWRNISVVAMFTAIYMNIYVQTDAMGNPSEVQTFLLRISALMTGVAIAFFVNWIFSVFGYRHMLEKRVYHILDDLEGKMKAVSQMVHEGRFEEAGKIMGGFSEFFNNVNWIYGTAVDFEKDPMVKRSQMKQVKLEKIMKMTNLTREIAHVTYDICYKVSKGDHHFKDPAFIDAFDRKIQSIGLLKDKLDLIIHNKPVNGEVAITDGIGDEMGLNHMNENIGLFDGLLEHY